MRKVLIVGMLMAGITSCNRHIVTFSVTDLVGEKPIRYQIRIPPGAKYIRADYQHTRAKVYLYPDSASLFFTNNTRSGMIYPEKFAKYGSDVGLQFVMNDTVILNGQDDKGRYWEERKMKNVVFGYTKVAPEKKALFDNLLKSIILK